MYSNNSSQTSVGSHKDKELPPIPSPLESPMEQKHSAVKIGDESKILETKSLKRKNFKKLSLDSSPVREKTANDDEHCNLEFSNSSLRQRRNQVRPAPLLNINRDRRSVNGDSKIKIKDGNLSIHQSNWDVESDAHLAPDHLINQFSDMKLSNIHDNGSNKNRKRQTVISSISPTNSDTNSVNDNRRKSTSFEKGSSSPGTPTIATTSSIKLNNKDLLTLKVLGSGNSGTVSKILHVPTQKTMAKKVIHIESKTVIQTQIIRELRILHECHSPYIIEFYGAFINNNNTIVICMEYGNCGSLDKILPLCKDKQFPLFVLKKLSYAILAGLTYLFDTHKIIHRDIKPSNVLMTHKGEFKLCDFGVSRELTNSLAMADTFVGTSMYMSPERIQGLTYGVKSDIWSMGLMLIELASGTHVWNEDDCSTGPEGILDLLQRIVNESPPSLTNKTNSVTKEPYDKQLCQFIDSCLVKDEAMRKSPSNLLQEKGGFLSGVIDGIFDKEVKSWAKGIRKLHKERNEEDNQ